MRDRIAISVRDLGLAYSLRAGLFSRSKQHWPFRGLNFDVYHGETLGIIGRNGVGKSSLLRTLAGIVRPDEGSVDTHGNRAALLALQAGFIPHLSGRQNALIGGLMLGMERQAIESRIDVIIEYSELGTSIDQPLLTYSSGMRSRLGFAIALQAQPDILLIDEALAVGDEQFRKKSMATMKGVIQSDRTVVMVSHGMPMLKKLCNRIIWIESGEVQMIGDSAGVIDQYVQFINGAGKASPAPDSC